MRCETLCRKVYRGDLPQWLLLDKRNSCRKADLAVPANEKFFLLKQKVFTFASAGTGFGPERERTLAAVQQSSNKLCSPHVLHEVSLSL